MQGGAAVATMRAHKRPVAMVHSAEVVHAPDKTMHPKLFRKLAQVVAVLAVGASRLAAQTPPAPPSSVSANYALRWGVKIPLRDKAELNATLYLPKNADGSPPKTPVIFTLTPYVSDTYHERGVYFAEHGYAFLLVDVRGRGNSGTSGGYQPPQRC